MNRPNLSRREFARLAAAALGGVVAGSAVGCGDGGGTPKPVGGGGPKPAGGEPVAGGGEMHVCAGLNGCKTKGVDEKNACAGQGGCASKAAHHECKQKNKCKSQGGCGETAGANACNGKGEGPVPMKDGTAWQKARTRFEEKMKAEGKTVGEPPTKPGASDAPKEDSGDKKPADAPKEGEGKKEE